MTDLDRARKWLREEEELIDGSLTIMNPANEDEIAERLAAEFAAVRLEERKACARLAAEFKSHQCFTEPCDKCRKCADSEGVACCIEHAIADRGAARAAKRG